MNTTDILLIVNSLLLGLISLLFMLIGYFIKDLHKDFKHMIERVNKLHSELQSHVTLFEHLAKVFQRQIDGLHERLRKVEKRMFNQMDKEK